MTRSILLLTSSFPPVIGGISSMMYEIARSLPSDAIQVVGLPTPGWKKFDIQQNFPVHRLNVPESWNSFSHQFKFLAPFYLESLLLRRHVRFIICDKAHHTYMIPAWLMYLLRGIPYGVFIHGRDVFYPQVRWYRGLFNHILYSAHSVFANSHATAEVVRSLGIRPERIHIIHPIINPSELITKYQPELLRNTFGLEGKKIILTVAHLRELKGIDTIISTMPKILSAIPEAHYLIVGEGPYEAELRAMVDQLELNNNVTFIGSKPHCEIADFFALCDVFAMVSRDTFERGELASFGESFGIVYLEANYLGKPVVAGLTGGVPDAVLHGQTGLLVDSKNPLRVADAIIHLLRNPDLAKQLGENGKRRVLTEFTGEVTAKMLLELLP